MTLDSEFVQILACPACKSPVEVKGEKVVCTQSACGLKYPIKDGIPVMLVDEAEKP